MNSLKCARCGLVNFATSPNCKRCEEPLDGSGRGAAQTHAPALTPPHGSAGLYYQPSGEVPLVGALGGLLVGLLAGVVLAFAYSYLVYYIPIIYLNFLCTIGYAAGLGLAVGGVMRLGKVRNGAASAGITVVAAFVSYYLSWAVWVSIVVSTGDSSVSALELAGQPLLLWELILKINEHGAWSLFKTEVTGFALWLIWGIEALIILIGTPLMASAQTSSDPFCENCQSWCAREQGVAVVALAESAEFKRRLEAKDFQYLREVGAKGEGDAEWLRVDLHHCPGCGQTNTLSVHKEKLSYDSKGNPSVSASSLLDNLLLNAADIRDLRAAGHDAAARPQPAFV
jgi:hypothetical protein